MKDQDGRFFKSQKRSLDSFFVDEAKANKAIIRKEKELAEIMEAKYGADPIYIN